MVLLNSAGAKIRLILATRDLKESKQFIRDVEKSKIAYILDHIADASAVDLAISEAVSAEAKMATVVVLDHALTADITEEIAARITGVMESGPEVRASGGSAARTGVRGAPLPYLVPDINELGPPGGQSAQFPLAFRAPQSVHAHGRGSSRHIPEHPHADPRVSPQNQAALNLAAASVRKGYRH